MNLKSLLRNLMELIIYYKEGVQMVSSTDLSYIEMAEDIAKETTCGILEVGCVIVKDNKVVATGANTTIEHYEPCDVVGHVLNDEGRCMRQIHAEANAILNGNKDDIKEATAYVTHEPCEYCTKLLNHSGIKKVVFKNSYPNPYNKHFIKPMEWIYLKNEGGTKNEVN